MRYELCECRHHTAFGLSAIDDGYETAEIGVECGEVDDCLAVDCSDGCSWFRAFGRRYVSRGCFDSV